MNRPPSIHQFAAGFTRGDAISNVCLEWQKRFRSWGHTSEIFVDPTCLLPALRDRAHAIDAYRPATGRADVLLLHLSIGSPVNDLFQQLPGPKIIVYHNITPAVYLRLINPRTALHLDHGRRQLAELATTGDLNLADSRFNARELEELGYRNVHVLPLPFNFEALQAPADTSFLRRFADPLTTVLFVGRCVPNKKIENLLNLFNVYQKSVNPNSRLIHVGAWQGAERYYALLTAQTREMHVENVTFTGMISQAQLNACYHRADVFVCLSEHEGFCMPLIEAMLHRVPVMALAAAAIPETLDGSGVLLNRLDYAVAAELLDRLARDTALRQAVITDQDRRIDRYRKNDGDAALRRLLEPYIIP